MRIQSDVDSFFKSQSNLDLSKADEKIITASDVNKIASTITGRTYDSSEIFSSALVNLKDSSNLQVSVDKSKITTVTGDIVYVTSPVSATGESALAGIMNCYEEATNVKIPETVKEAANKEIYTQAEVVENSNVSADKVSKLVDDVKVTVKEKNVTDHQTIVNIINNYTVNNNINISNNDVENIANSIEQTQKTQGDINNYETQVSNILNSTGGSDAAKGFLEGLFG